MSINRNIFYLFLALLFVAISCNKDDTTPETPPIEEEKYETIPFSISIGITPMSSSVEGLELKQTFSDGDVVEISNSQVLYEPLIISTNGYEGKSQLVYSGELKVKKGAELVSGTTTLTAALKNGTNYNNGKPFIDVKKVSSFAEGLEKYSCWMCQDFTYNADAISINLVQSTVYLNINLFGTKVSMKYGLAFYNEMVGSDCIYAVPFGTTIECDGLNLLQKLDVKDKYFYRIGFSTPANCLKGLFSVGENKSVFFAKGNLEYRPLDGTWRLAPQQLHTCFNFTKKTDLGENYANWMGEDKWTDLFKWESLSDCISALGNGWTVLTIDEWCYLCSQRPDALNKRGGAIVDGVAGWIILPDEWVMPDGVTPFLGQYHVKYTKDIPNNYTIEEWIKMESAGAVFLPGTGYMNGSTYYLFYSMASTEYQSMSYDEANDKGYVMSFDDMTGSFCRYNISYSFDKSFPVRLVQYKAETSDIQVE